MPETGTRTVTAQVALWPPFAVVAVMVADPVPTPVTRPDEFTVATLVLLDVQVSDLSEAVAGATVAVSCCVLPFIIVVVVGEIVTPLVGVVTDTVHEALWLPSAVVAVIVAVPLATAVTRPEAFTVATPVLLEAHE